MKNRQAKIIGTPKHDRQKQEMKDRQAEIIGTAEHERRKQQMKDRHKEKVGKSHNEQADSPSLKVVSFEIEIQDRPYYICVVCNRCQYRKLACCFDIQR